MRTSTPDVTAAHGQDNRDLRRSRRSVAVSILLLAAALAACTHVKPRSDYDEWRIRGRVIAMTHDYLRVQHKSGRVFEVALDDRTLYFVNHKPDSLQAVHLGTRVTLDLEHHANGELLALRVQLFR